MRNNEAAIIDRQPRSAETVNGAAMIIILARAEGSKPAATDFVPARFAGSQVLTPSFAAKWLTDAGEASTQRG